MAIMINPLIARSTGITSPVYVSLQSIVRMTPLAPPTNIPIGPFKLSTHPGKGSSNAGVTGIAKTKKIVKFQ